MAVAAISVVIEDNPDLLGVIAVTTQRRFGELIAQAIVAKAAKAADGQQGQALLYRRRSLARIVHEVAGAPVVGAAEPSA